MPFRFLNDPEFLNYNFSALLDPTLKPGGGPDEITLYKLVLQSRWGDRTTAAYADTMHWTLRPAAFNSFQASFGARPIEQRDWFYSKLHQFFCVLLHDSIQVQGRDGNLGRPKTNRPWAEGRMLVTGPQIDPDELEEAFSPDDHATCNWREFVDVAVADALNDDRLAKVRALIRERARPQAKRIGQQIGPRKTVREWSKNSKRNEIIRAGLKDGQSPREICRELAARRIATTLQMQANDIETWVAAWNDKEFRKDVQSIISRVKASGACQAV
jgi:hypothetical protein